MPHYLVTVTQTETRAYSLHADSEDAAREQAEAWAEERSGGTPEGCDRYEYGFDSNTDVQGPPATPAELCERYSTRLDELEISPNGDDFNNLLQILQTGDYIEPHVSGR